MARNNTLGGTVFVKVNGRQIPLRGSIKNSPELLEGEGRAGMDGPHGFIEKPKMPSFEGEFSATSDITLTELRTIKDATWVVEMNSGRRFTYIEGRVTTALELDSAEGSFTMKVEAMDCHEELA